MQRLYHPPNPFTMTAAELRTDLLQQIEQADEKLLRIVSSVLEAVKVEYITTPRSEADRLEILGPAMTAEEYEASLKPMSREELEARAEASNADIAAGRVHSSEEVRELLGL